MIRKSSSKSLEDVSVDAEGEETVESAADGAVEDINASVEEAELPVETDSVDAADAPAPGKLAAAR